MLTGTWLRRSKPVITCWILSGLIGLSDAAEKAEPCAVIQKLGGDVQILDASREKFLPTQPDSSIVCGSWISTADGWALLKNRGGSETRLGPQTFIQVNEHILVFRGEIHAVHRAGKGRSDELQVLTANARIKFANARGLVIFDERSEETQLVGLHKVAEIENRFMPGKAIRVEAGEASSLRKKSDSVLPDQPQAVDLLGLKKKLESFRLDESEQKMALQVAKSRQDRKFATELKATQKTNRQIASKQDSSHHYERNPAGNEDGINAEQMILRRLVPIAGEAHALAFPNSGRSPASANSTAVSGKKKNHGRKPQSVRAEDDFYKTAAKPAESARKRRKQEEVERKRLIQELSRLHTY